MLTYFFGSAKTELLKDSSRCPKYEEIFNRSRMHSIDNYAFQGTKLDISKELLGKSVFTLSNTDRGISMNYSFNAISNLFSVSLFGDGSILGKIGSSDGEGASLICMKGVTHGYFDLGFTKSFSYGSLSLKVINPDLNTGVDSGVLKDSVLFAANSLYKQGSLGFSENIESISGSFRKAPACFKSFLASTKTKLFPLEVRSCKSRLCNSLFNMAQSAFNGGIFSLSGVLQLTPSLHLANETLFSISSLQNMKEKPGGHADKPAPETSSLVSEVRYAKEVSYTSIITKAFETWRIVGMLQMPGPLGLVVEKALDDSISVHAEVSFDHRSFICKENSLSSSIACASGITIATPNITTRVSAGSNGTTAASSDISIGDGAVLNLSAKVSSGGPLLGIGFTFAS